MAVVKRTGTIVFVVLVALSMLGGHFSNAHARDCAHTAPAASLSLHVHHPSNTDPSNTDAVSTDRFHRPGPAGIGCDGRFCPMTGCCLPRITAKVETPRTPSSAMPLLLAVDASGTDPAKVERPPRHP